MVDAMVDRWDGVRATRDPVRCREQLMAAGRTLFAVYGYARTSVEDLCAAANVQPRDFYREFESREALLVDLYDEVAIGGMRAVEVELSAEGMETCSTEERFRRLFDAYVRVVTRDSRAARVAFVEVLGVSRAMDDHLTMWRSVWVEFLTREAERAAERGHGADGDLTVVVKVLTRSVDELLAHHGRRPRQVPCDWLTSELTRMSLAMMGPDVSPEAPA
ncbi:TetR/AcrR family transcriptional regulator [Streptomyces sp. NBC_01260]|uniref:TetR/AcrR family transcriptional regulator n=1 Tax=unclassified Streptomyces TaxID=2593676 RepID=UPI000F466078|nr:MULTISPECIES: TetR/AcrR family transcriptional regulator [unclassified Streptomyces]MCX4770747.1 TetR/AcrR family transcriptional regulator [Streptomyces sp. NBC_01285]ROQ81870.1 TetR family transcriptional regulator [Streptomyces sp. CEV 2-1]RPK46138.1 Transcriptional regulator, TetR family [Streptomyces sp. ADI92-24]